MRAAAAGDCLDHNRAVRAKRTEESMSASKVRRPFGAFNHRKMEAMARARAFALSPNAPKLRETGRYK